MRKGSYNDIVTLAVVFLFYFVVEWLNGSGVIFALIFGIILGNGIGLTKLLKFKHPIETTEVMKGFTAQIYFFIKTFFFLYLGSIISFSNPINAIFGVAAAFILLFIRFIAVLLSSIGSSQLLSNKGVITTMLARGESSAVLVQIVAVSQIPNAAIYPDIVMAIIITTTIISALGIVIFARKKQPVKELSNTPA
jgi:cell volume regulation protein A